MKRSFIESFERYLLKEAMSADDTNYTIWIKNSDKHFEKNNVNDKVALKEIVKIIKSLTAEEKKNLELGWVTADEDEEVVVSVYAQEEGMSIEDRIIHNWEYAATLIEEALEETGLINDSSSYLIKVEGTEKSQENKGIVDEDALEEILDFISELSPEEKKNVALFWNLDEEKSGDGDGDVIVSVYGPSERAEWTEEDQADHENWTLTNWAYAERQIRRALGLPRK